jgi:hypothetical protein
MHTREQNLAVANQAIAFTQRGGNSRAGGTKKALAPGQGFLKA